ncbi:MAG: methionyl-tRNA formyltransferase [Hyphomicrobiales bacterium]|nr:methionyl-tRNA formyltransferase [Hyphomicrobiales bacterium]
MRLIFMGTPAFSVPTLAALAGQGHEIAAVYTRAPQPAGRGMALKRTPVHEAALALGLHVETPAHFRDAEAVAQFAALGADAAIVVAYGLILPPAILAATTAGCLNLHASLLPRWRGAAPIQRALMAGDAETGVMVMSMEAGLDTGPVAMVEHLALGETMNAGQAHDALAALGADLMVRAVSALGRGSLVFVPQSDEGVTYAHKISKAETRLDFTQSARDLHNKVRGLAPAPGAWFEANIGHGPERIKVIRSEIVAATGAPGTLLAEPGVIACADGALRLLSLQRAGHKALALAEALRGITWPAGGHVP